MRKGEEGRRERADVAMRYLVEVIDRGCNENGGVTRRVRGYGGKKRRERGG